MEKTKDTGQVSLLFTDIVLPKGISGLKLGALLEKMRPSLEVLYTTGYAESVVIDEDGLGMGINMISKPYRRADFLERIRSMIDCSAG